MSNKTERTAMTDLALKAWDEVVTMLAERGETMLNTDCRNWTPGLNLAMESAKALAQACAIIGAHEASDLRRLQELHERTHHQR